jgi:hypothetical protein
MDNTVVSILRWTPSLLMAIVVYTLTLAAYRLYFNPLENTPGRKLATATGWYEFYFECILTGQYVFEIQGMHKEYGQ